MFGQAYVKKGMMRSPSLPEHPTDNIRVEMHSKGWVSAFGGGGGQMS